MIGIKELVYANIIAFTVVLMLGPILIPMLKRFKFGQVVRDDGPRTHIVKNGTPTMGGVMIIAGIVFASVIMVGFKLNADMTIGLISVCGFGGIGFLDDYIIIRKKRSLGLTAKQKIALQFALALIIVVYQYTTSFAATIVDVPFINKGIDIGLLYIPFMVFAVVGVVNSVNLTDGLDGLASGTTVVVGIFFMIISNIVFENKDVTFLAAATVGACIGFLIYNSYPAKIFMGDTGSMALGGSVAVCAVLTNSMMIVPVVGGIYFAEALSVIIQVTVYKWKRKRVFKMAPLHHHFEQCGWKETKVVFTFWLVSVFLLGVGILIIGV